MPVSKRSIKPTNIHTPQMTTQVFCCRVNTRFGKRKLCILRFVHAAKWVKILNSPFYGRGGGRYLPALI